MTGVAIVLALIALYAVCARALDGLSITGAMIFTAVGIAVGAAAGCAVGALGALMLLFCRRRQLSTALSEDVGVLSLAVLSFALAVALSGNGFVAAFCGGLALGTVSRGRLREGLVVSETVASVLSLLMWTVFGALMAAPLLAGDFSWRPVVYAVLTLTVLRTIAVIVAMVGSGARAPTVAFMGWFGPRGLASAVFAADALLALEHIAPQTASTVLTTTTWTILLSVVLHGVSARALARRYGRWVERLDERSFERRSGPAFTHRHRSLGARSATTEAER